MDPISVALAAQSTGLATAQRSTATIGAQVRNTAGRELTRTLARQLGEAGAGGGSAGGSGLGAVGGFRSYSGTFGSTQADATNATTSKRFIWSPFGGARAPGTPRPG